MEKMKQIESCVLAEKMKEKYQRAERAGWDQSGKRGKDNHTIMISRAEAVDLADRLYINAYMAAVYSFERMHLVRIMEKLAEIEDDIIKCPECHNIYRSKWMNGKCVYCDCRKKALKEVDDMMEQMGV